MQMELQPTRITIRKQMWIKTHTRTMRRALRLPITKRDKSSDMSSARLSCGDARVSAGRTTTARALAKKQTGVPVPLPSSLEKAKGLRRLACSSAYLHPSSSKNRTQDLCCKIACTLPILRPPNCDSSARISSSAACARPEIPQLGKQLHVIRPQALHFFLRGLLLPVQPAVSRRQAERVRAAVSKRACLRCVAASRSSCSMRARSCWRCTDRIPVIASSLVVATTAEAGDGPGAAGVVANSAERDAASEAAGKLLAADETADAAGDTLPSGVNTKCG